MAKSKTTETTSVKSPDYICWTVTSTGDTAFWNRMGAAWQHKDGKGLSLKLDTLPVDGRIVLRRPLAAAEGART